MITQTSMVLNKVVEKLALHNQEAVIELFRFSTLPCLVDYLTNAGTSF